MALRRDPQIGLGRAIRRLRDQRELTQEQLADLAELSQVSLSRLESGHVNPQFSTVLRVAAALRVSGSEFVALAEQLEPGSDAAGTR